MTDERQDTPTQHSPTQDSVSHGDAQRRDWQPEDSTLQDAPYSDYAPSATESPGQDTESRESQARVAPARRPGPHVDRVARIIERRLRNGGERKFSLAEAERINVTTGWTYRYHAVSGHVVRTEGVSLPSDDLLAAWRLAKSYAAGDVAA